MNTNLLFITLLTLTLGIDIPKIDIYIESLCPFSGSFVVTSFKEFHQFENKAKLADVTFYSHGKSTENNDGTFECQHGDNECLGNLIHTCAKANLNKEEFHSFLICLFEDVEFPNEDFFESLYHCTPSSIADSIKTCAKSETGNELQQKVAEKTPDQLTVPYIGVDGQHDTNVEIQIEHNMLKYLCKDRQDVEGCKEVMSVVSVPRLHSK
jgi:interferon gamma-inducible protein 30